MIDAKVLEQPAANRRGLIYINRRATTTRPVASSGSAVSRQQWLPPSMRYRLKRSYSLNGVSSPRSDGSHRVIDNRGKACRIRAGACASASGPPSRASISASSSALRPMTTLAPENIDSRNVTPPRPVLLPRKLALASLPFWSARIRKRMRVGEGTLLQADSLSPRGRGLG